MIREFKSVSNTPELKDEKSIFIDVDNIDYAHEIVSDRGTKIAVFLKGREYPIYVYTTVDEFRKTLFPSDVSDFSIPNITGGCYTGYTDGDGIIRPKGPIWTSEEPLKCVKPESSNEDNQHKYTLKTLNLDVPDEQKVRFLGEADDDRTKVYEWGDVKSDLEKCMEVKQTKSVDGILEITVNEEDFNHIMNITDMEYYENVDSYGPNDKDLITFTEDPSIKDGIPMMKAIYNLRYDKLPYIVKMMEVRAGYVMTDDTKSNYMFTVGPRDFETLKCLYEDDEL